MSDIIVTDSIIYVGVDDTTLDLFESQYHVPNGVSYNSYVIMDEKTAVMDTTDPRVTEEWLNKVEQALGGREPDYLVINHMEPDHAGNIQKREIRFPSEIIRFSFSWLPWFTGRRQWLRMSSPRRFFFPRTDSENSARWMLKRSGPMKRGAILSIL